MEVRELNSEAELKALARRQTPRLRRRIKAVILAKQGHSASQVARAIGCSVRSVQMWMDSYNQGGVEALVRWWAPQSKTAEPSVNLYTPDAQFEIPIATTEQSDSSIAQGERA